MLCPPGHSSFEKIIGQFSKASLTPWSAREGEGVGPDLCASSQFSSSVFAASPPQKVLTSADAHQLRGDDHLLQMVHHRLAVLRVRRERVGIVAQRRDGDLPLAQRVDDLLRLAPRSRLATSMWLVPA